MTTDTRHDLSPITLTPDGPYRCGDTLTASWTLTNFSDIDFAGSLLHFEYSSGCQIDVDKARIPETDRSSDAFVLEGEPITGIPLKTLSPGESITVTFPIHVGKVTSEEVVQITAVLRSEEGIQFVSEPCVIAIRHVTKLVVPQPEIFTIKADNQHFGMRISVQNDGGLAEEDVQIRIPVPVGINVATPREQEDVQVSFNEGQRIISCSIRTLRPYSSVDISLQFEANEDLVGDVIEIDDITVTSPAGGTFHLEPVEARLDASVDLSQSKILTEPRPYMESGQTIEITTYVHNSGRSHARDSVVSLVLPDELLYAPGTLCINGAVDARQDSIEEVHIPLLRSHTTTLVTCKATVLSPSENGKQFKISGSVNGEEIEPCVCSIISGPQFPLEENYLWTDEPLSIEPHTERHVRVNVCNTGTDVARHVRLRVNTQEIVIRKITINKNGVEEVGVIIPILDNQNLPSSAIDLGNVEPHENVIVTLHVVAPETFKHEDVFVLTCFLRYDGQNEVQLDSKTFIGRSYPHISSRSSVHSQRVDNLRIGQQRNLSIHLKNDGSDVARNVTVRLDLPVNISIERVDGAVLDNESILFHDIPAQSSSEATITIRVVGTSAGEGVVEVHPIVRGDRLNTVHLEPLILNTTSQSFLDDIVVVTTPSEDVGTVIVSLSFKNVGDGPATHITVRAKTLDGYLPNTTIIDGNTYRDINGRSPLSYGLPLTPIISGQTFEISYAIHPQDDEPLLPIFIVTSDDQPPMEAQGQVYRPALTYRFVPEFITTSRPRALQPAIPTAEAMEHVDEHKNVSLESLLQQKEVKQEPSQQEEVKQESPRQEDEVKQEPSLQDDEVEILGQKPPLQNKSDVSEQNLPLQDDEVEILGQKSPLQDDKADVSEQKLSLQDDEVEIKEKEHSTREDDLEKESPLVMKRTETPVVQEDGARQEDKIGEDVPGDDRTVYTQEEDLKATINEKPNSESIVQEEENVETPKRQSPLILSGKSPFGKARSNETIHLHGPISLFTYDKAKRARIKSVMTLLRKRDDLGWYRHVFTMRLFVPDSIRGVTKDMEDRWIATHSALQSDFKIPFMRLMIPTFEINEEWGSFFNNEVANTAFAPVLQGMLQAFKEDAPSVISEEEQRDLIYGNISTGNFEYADIKEMPTYPHLNAIFPEMIPTLSSDYPKLAESLGTYKSILAERFSPLVYKAINAQHERLLRAPGDDMDEAFEKVYATLEAV